MFLVAKGNSSTIDQNDPFLTSTNLVYASVCILVAENITGGTVGWIENG